MTIRTVLIYPDPRLRKQSLPVTEFNDELQRLIDDMFETQFHTLGAGLAAPQINEHRQVITIDISPEKNQPLVLINPEITQAEGSMKNDEGCLSLPGVRAMVERPECIHFKALDRHGNPFEMQAEGYLACAVQHEMDHLKGKLYIDHLSTLKRKKTLRELKRAQHEPTD